MLHQDQSFIWNHRTSFFEQMTNPFNPEINTKRKHFTAVEPRCESGFPDVPSAGQLCLGVSCSDRFPLTPPNCIWTWKSANGRFSRKEHKKPLQREEEGVGAEEGVMRVQEGLSSGLCPNCGLQRSLAFTCPLSCCRRCRLLRPSARQH